MESTKGGRGTLPTYASPPAVEVAVGVEFVPIPTLGIVRLVQVHQRWEGDYPKAIEQPPLMPSSHPIPDAAFAGVGLVLGQGVGPLRLWMMSPDERMLFQAQNDRLILNWRRLGGDVEYPRYSNMRDEYLARWRDFVDALDGDVQPTTAEVTFVNAISVPEGVGDLSSVLRTQNNPTLPDGVTPFLSHVRFVGNVRARESDSTIGQLQIVAEPTSERDLQLTVTTRVGLLGGATNEDRLLAALDRAHECCVLGFTDITTQRMHQSWGRQR